MSAMVIPWENVALVHADLDPGRLCGYICAESCALTGKKIPKE